jgi:hypothetical protein
MKSELRNLITCIETDQPQGMISYLDAEIKSESPNVWAGGMPSTDSSTYSEIGIASKSLVISAESYQVRSTFSLEMAKDLQELHGVNVSDMLKSTLINEMEQTVEKKILEKMKESAEEIRKEGWSKFQLWANKWFGYSPKIVWASTDQLVSQIMSRSNKILSETRTGGTPFIIVSPAVASILGDSQSFYFSNERHVNNTGSIYQFGILGNRIIVLINPNFGFSDLEVLMGIKPESSTSSRIFMIENPESIFDERADVSGMGKAFSLQRRFGFKSVESKNYTFFEITKQGKNHNFLTHILSKIKSYFKKK